jgi:hypothetical protein
MVEFEATVFKLGERAVIGLGRVAFPLGADGVAQQRVSANGFGQLLDVGLPVGGAM